MKNLLYTTLVLLLASCTTGSKPTITEIKKIDITAQSTNPNSEIGAYIAKYKTEKDKKMNKVIAHTDQALSITRHDSPLGNTIAEMMFETGNAEYDVDLAITNFGGIRRNLEAGDITLSDIYEILPFDNSLVVLRYSGKVLHDIANTIAAKGGEAMYGITFDIVDKEAHNIMVQGKKLSLESTYTVVTNDYLQRGNDYLDPMALYTEALELPILMRDVAITGFARKYPPLSEDDSQAHESEKPLNTVSATSSNNVNTKQQSDKLCLVFTNDTHSQIEPTKGIGGYEARLRVLDSVRAIYPNTLTLDAGDMWQGSPYFNLYFGRAEVEGYNIMGYDASTIGNHEFDHGLDTLAARIKEMHFPMLNANYDFTNTPLDGLTKPYELFSLGNWRVGVIGVGINPDGIIPQKAYGNIVYGEPIDSVNKYAELLKHELNCDFVVVLSHLGYVGEGYELQTDDYKLARNTRNVDIIMGGHTHGIDSTFMIPNLNNREIPVAQSSKYGKDIYCIIVES